MMDGNTEFVISMNQLATVLAKYNSTRMTWPDGSYVVDYDEIDPEEPVKLDELVRCGSCRWYNTSVKGVDGSCDYHNVYGVDPDEFCSWAEKVVE